MTTPVHIPSYLSESTFRTYEPYIARAVAAWPEETSFTTFVTPDGKKLSANTFVARFRDAITSLRRFGWETTAVDLTKLASIMGDFCLTLDPQGVVWFRHKTKQGRPPEFRSETVAMYPEKGAKAVREVWQKWTLAEVNALCQLLDTGRLVGPFVVEGQVDAGEITRLEGLHNVSFTYDPTKNQTIIL